MSCLVEVVSCLVEVVRFDYHFLNVRAGTIGGGLGPAGTQEFV